MTPKTKALLALTALALCGVLAAGCAEDRGPPADAHHAGKRAQGQRQTAAVARITPEVFLFLEYDADHDHRITKDELKSAIDTSWRQLAKGRSSVSLIELRDWLTTVYGAPSVDFGPLDFAPEGASVVTRESFAATLTRRFEILDVNQDGVLEREEFVTLRQPMRDGRSGGGMAPGGMMGPPGGQGPN